MYYLYILKCSDNSYYTGITNNLEKRFDMHNKGTGSKYVRARLPFIHVYTEKFEDRSIAQKREYEVKHMSRDEKIKLIN